MLKLKRVNMLTSTLLKEKVYRLALNDNSRLEPAATIPEE